MYVYICIYTYIYIFIYTVPGGRVYTHTHTHMSSAPCSLRGSSVLYSTPKKIVFMFYESRYSVPA